MGETNRDHNSCDRFSRAICDKIYSELSAQCDEKINKNENEIGCSYSVQGCSHFAELFHRSSPAVRIEFRADPDPAKRPPTSKRIKIFDNENKGKNKWFPYYIDIKIDPNLDDIDTIAAEAASKLIRYAIPASKKD